jgi:hypothetical protein
MPGMTDNNTSKPRHIVVNFQNSGDKMNVPQREKKISNIKDQRADCK